MIRLVASDMDGTLLKDDKTVDSEIYRLIKKMGEQSVYFCAASGRQYQSLSGLFETNSHTFFAAENGAYVVYEGKEIYSSVMEPTLVKHILCNIEQLEYAECMLSGKKCAYTTNPHTVQYMSEGRFGYCIQLVDNLYEVKDDVVKISMIENRCTEGLGYQKIVEALEGKAQIATSGFQCIDIMNKGVSKGLAIESIQYKLGIGKEETMVFGDNYNDVEMFQRAYYSFAMRNAEEGVKKHARFITGSNNEGSVLEEMKKIL